MKQTFFVLLLALFLACTVGAQPVPENFEYAVLPAMTEITGEADTDGGGEVDLQVVMNYTNAEAPGIQGWSLGVMLEPGDTTMEMLSADNSEEVMTVKDGGPPQYQQLNFDEEADTVTQGIVLDFAGAVKIDAAQATDFPIIDVTVSIDGHFVPVDPDTGEPTEDPQCGSVVITDTVGSPPVDDVITVEGQSYTPGSEPPAEICLIPEFVPPAQDCFAIMVGDAGGDTDEEVSSDIVLNFSANPDDPTEDPVQGWSYGACMDDTSKAIVTDAVTGADTAAVKDGGAPDYDQLNIWDEGLTHGVVIDFSSVVVLSPDDPNFTSFVDVTATYKVLMTEEGDSTTLTPCTDTLGSPPVANVMVIGGQSVAECVDQNVPGTISFKPPPPLPSFLPGDANADGRLDIADGIYILNALFRGGPDFSCEAAADFNNDGVVDASDAVGLIYWRFQPDDECPDGCPGPALGTECGPQETELSCEQPQC